MNKNLVLPFLVFSALGCMQQERGGGKVDFSGLSPEQKAALNKVNADPVFSNTDMGVWVRGQTIADIINSINTISANLRTVKIQVTEQKDKLLNEADYYVELYDLPNNNAVGELAGVNAVWSKDGKLKFTTDLNVRGNARIHGHYNPLNVGGHAGFSMGAKTQLSGQINFAKSDSPERLFDASFELFPANLNWSMKTGIADKKEWCWQMDLPFGGEAKDCKILWQYDIPISISDSYNIKTDSAISLPVKINLPDVIRLNDQKGGVAFDKFIKVDVSPEGFKADGEGLAVRVQVNVKEVSKSTASALLR